MKHALAFFHCLTPLHNGAGEAFGAIDRPILREVTTGYPYVQSSSIKGALRDIARRRGEDGALIKLAFGPDADSGQPAQGRILFGDAQLLFFPARSLVRTFAWTTARLPLGRFSDQLNRCGDRKLEAQFRTLCRNPLAFGTAWGAPDLAIPSTERLAIERLVLERKVDSAPNQCLSELLEKVAGVLFPAETFWASYFHEQSIMIDSESFSHLVERATVIEANIRIQATGVTKIGSLRYSEYLPAETVLTCPIVIDPLPGERRDEDMEELEALMQRLFSLEAIESSPPGSSSATEPAAHAPAMLQLGADESKGKGLVRGFYVDRLPDETNQNEAGNGATVSGTTVAEAEEVSDGPDEGVFKA